MIDIDKLDEDWEKIGMTGVINIGERWPEIVRELRAGRKLRDCFHKGYFMADIHKACEDYDREVER